MTMILIGTNKKSIRVQRKGSWPELLEWGRDLRFWAIFWEYLPFKGKLQNSIDEDYFVCQWQDPYWRARGKLDYDYSRAPS